MRRIQKGTSPPNVGGGVRKVKKKYIDQNQQGDTASKGVGAACGTIRTSTWHRPEMRRQKQQLMEPRSGLGPHRRSGAQKRGLMKVSITISSFFHFANRISPLVFFIISPCKLVCILCTISPDSLHPLTIIR